MTAKNNFTFLVNPVITVNKHFRLEMHTTTLSTLNLQRQPKTDIAHTGPKVDFCANIYITKKSSDFEDSLKTGAKMNKNVDIDQCAHRILHLRVTSHCAWKMPCFARFECIKRKTHINFLIIFTSSGEFNARRGEAFKNNNFLRLVTTVQKAMTKHF